MKRFSAVMMVLLFAAQGFAAEAVKVSGSLELQYRSSSDLYDAEGGDEMGPEELYVQFEKTVAEGIDVLLKLDGADMAKDGDDTKYVEEANLTFNKAGMEGLTLVVGKDEMPFGQDYEKFFLSSETHGLEIDKVWGVNGNYNLKKAGHIALGFFEIDGIDAALTDSYALRFTPDFGKKLSAELSYAVKSKDKSVVGEENETRTNAGFVLKPDSNITIHGEYTNIGNVDNIDGADSKVMLAGVDYRYRKYLFKARYETVDDDRDSDITTDPTDPVLIAEKRMAAGIDYNYNDRTRIAVEYETASYNDDGALSVDDSAELLVGIKTIF